MNLDEIHGNDITLKRTNIEWELTYQQKKPKLENNIFNRLKGNKYLEYIKAFSKQKKHKTWKFAPKRPSIKENFKVVLQQRKMITERSSKI